MRLYPLFSPPDLQTDRQTLWDRWWEDPVYALSEPSYYIWLPKYWLRRIYLIIVQKKNPVYFLVMFSSHL